MTNFANDATARLDELEEWRDDYELVDEDAPAEMPDAAEPLRRLQNFSDMMERSYEGVCKIVFHRVECVEAQCKEYKHPFEQSGSPAPHGAHSSLGDLRERQEATYPMGQSGNARPASIFELSDSPYRASDTSSISDSALCFQDIGPLSSDVSAGDPPATIQAEDQEAAPPPSRIQPSAPELVPNIRGAHRRLLRPIALPWRSTRQRSSS